MLGDMIGEFRGKASGYRVLSEGKVEVSQQGMGKLLGFDASMATTGTMSPMPNGVLMVVAMG
jgi:hypothetical protein